MTEHQMRRILIEMVGAQINLNFAVRAMYSRMQNPSLPLPDLSKQDFIAKSLEDASKHIDDMLKELSNG